MPRWKLEESRGYWCGEIRFENPNKHVLVLRGNLQLIQQLIHMEMTRHILSVGRKWRWLTSNYRNNTCVGIGVPHSMSVTTKTSDRAAVHGVKPPLPDILHVPFSYPNHFLYSFIYHDHDKHLNSWVLNYVQKEQVKKDIDKAKQDKEAKRIHIEKTIHSYLTKYDSP